MTVDEFTVSVGVRVEHYWVDRAGTQWCLLLINGMPLLACEVDY